MNLSETVAEQHLWLSIAVPLIPLLARWTVLARYRPFWADPIPDGQAEIHRTFILSLAGFSLAGLSIIASAATQSDGRYADAFVDLVISFLLYFICLSIQSWKHKRWHDHLADGLRDAANGSLLLFIVRLTFGFNGLPAVHAVLVTLLAFGAWIGDWIPTLVRTNTFLSAGKLVAPLDATSNRGQGQS